MGFRELTKKETEWLASLRKNYAEKVYEHVYYRLVKNGSEAGAAAEEAEKRTIQAFEQLAETAMSIPFFRLKRRALYKKPENAFAFLMKASSYLMPDESEWLNKAIAYFESTVWKNNIGKIPEAMRDDAYQDSITKLIEHIVGDRENFEKISGSDQELERWMQAVLSNDVGYYTPYRLKNAFTSGKIWKQSKKNSKEIAILSEEEIQMGRKGVTLDTVSYQAFSEENAFLREDDLSKRDEYAYQLVLSATAEMQKILYLALVEGYSMEEIADKLQLEVKPGTLDQRCRRAAESMRKKLNASYPITDDELNERRWRPPKNKKKAGKKDFS